jgi:hypothetical protein
MTIPRRVALRARGPAARWLPVALAIAVAGCTDLLAPTASPVPSQAAAPTPSASPPLTPQPTPTPAPTPRFTNEPDPELAALVPATANGLPVVVPPVTEFGLTPGEVGMSFGELGARFASLVLAFVERPRLSLYAMRVDGEPVTTADLEPHLAAAGRMVGISGLHREPWQQATVGGNVVWVRPEDNATAAGTMIYLWSSGEFVFLLIGVDDALNRAIVAALPGEAPPTPTPAPSRSPRTAPSPSTGASASATP